MNYPNFQFPAIFAIGAIVLFGNAAEAQISYVSGTYTQNFDALATAAAVTANAFPFEDNITLPGWYATSLTTNFNGQLSTFTLTGTVSDRADVYSITNGSTNAGDLFSLGAFSSTDRALGAVGSSGVDYFIAVRFTNDTGRPLKSFTITYDGEQWRRGGTATERPESMHVFYRIGGTVIDDTGTWVNVPELIFTSPNILPAQGLAAALDGNLPENRVAGITKTVVADVPAGASLWILFADADDFGNDHALGIDNFSFSAEVNTGEPVVVGPGNAFTANSFAGSAFSAVDNAVFSGPGKIVTLSNSAGPVVAAGLNFNTSGFTLAGDASSPLLLNGAVTVAEAVTATISGVLTGTLGFEQKGAGGLTLSGVNTFTGGVKIEGELTVSSDSAFGNPDNDVSFTSSSASLILPSGFTLGGGRTFGGSGTLKTPDGGTLTFAGPLAAGGLVLDGVTTLNFGGATNTIGGLTTSGPVSVNSVGSILQLTAGNLNFNQTAGNSSLTGGFTTIGDRGVFVGGGAVNVTGNVTLGGRIIKTGPGTLDLSGAAVAGSTPTAGSYRIGVQGGAPVEGGTVRISSGAALGGLSQVQFNSGALEIIGSAEAAVGLSIGGRTNSSVSVPTISGGPLTLTGTSGYFNAPGGSDGDVLFNVNNVTTLAGSINPTSFTSTAPIWVGAGGSGTLVIAGNAGRLIDFFIVSNSLTLVIDGTLGGERLLVEAEATVSGSGVFAGSSPWEDADGIPTNNLTQPANPIWVASTADINGTLAPSGVLTIRASTTMSSGARTVFSIDGVVRGTSYSALAFEVPPDSGFNYSLQQNGAVTLDFGAPAISGDYQLISTGAGVTRSGGFSSVVLAGSHTGTLTKSGLVWSGTSGGTTFSFNESTGVLTVTGGASATTPLQNWRLANFGSTDNTGNAADGADFDGDGITNLIEYATGTNPTVANTSAVVVGRNGSGEFLTLSFNRIADPALTYTVVSGSDLAAGLTTVAQTYGGTATDTVVYTDTVSLNTPGVRRFLALRVSYGDN